MITLASLIVAVLIGITLLLCAAMGIAIYKMLWNHYGK